MCWWRLWAGSSATAERRSGIAIPSRGQPKDPQEALSPALHLVALHCRHINYDNNDNNSNIKPTFSVHVNNMKGLRHSAVAMEASRGCSLDAFGIVHDSPVAPLWLYSYVILQKQAPFGLEDW